MPQAPNRRIAAALALTAVVLTVGGIRSRPERHCCAEAASSPTARHSAAATTHSPQSSPAAQTPATPTSAPPSTSPPAPVSAKQLAGDLDRIFGAGDSYSVAALDLTTGRSSRLGAGGGMVLASLVKLDFLETLLYQHQLSGQPLTDGQAGDAEAMIEQSDNAAADRVWFSVGKNPGVRSYNSLLGLHDTVFRSDGVWGLSTTSARDQLALLQALTSAHSPLSAASRGYALGLLSDVESDQRWGVSAAGDPDSDAAAKNGWLNIDSDDGLWAVNSAGVLRVDGHQVLMVVLSQHQPDYATAVARVQQAAVKLAATL